VTDDGNYYYVIPNSWGLEECASMLVALHGQVFTLNAWKTALANSHKQVKGEVGRAGGLIFVRSEGPKLC
jgi:hypothetical protein